MGSTCPSLDLGIARLLHPHCLSLSSRHLSLPWVTASIWSTISASSQPPTPACTEQTAADRLHLGKHPFQHVTSFPCSTCSKSFSDSPFPVKWDPNSFTIWPESSNSTSPSCPIPHSLFSTCSSVSREGLLTVPMHCHLIPQPYCTSIFENPTRPSEVLPPAGSFP